MKDFYYILGLDINCSELEIKAAFRKLSKKFHPDKNLDDQKYFESRFKDILEAYEILSDPIKRIQYNQKLKNSHSSSIEDELEKQQFYKEQGEKLRRREEELERREDKLRREHANTQSTPKPNPQYQPPPSPQPNSQYQTQSNSKNKSEDSGVGTFIAIFIVIIFIAFVVLQSIKNGSTNTANVDSITYDSVAKDVIADTSVMKKHNNTLRKIESPLIDSNPVRDIGLDSFLYITHLRPNLETIKLKTFDEANSKIIESISTESEIYVIEEGRIYDKVSVDGYIGYIQKKFLVDSQ